MCAIVENICTTGFNIIENALKWSISVHKELFLGHIMDSYEFQLILFGSQFLNTISLPFSTPVHGFKSLPSNWGVLSGPAKYAFDQSKLILSNAHFGTCSVSAFGSQVIIESLMRLTKVYKPDDQT